MAARWYLVFFILIITVFKARSQDFLWANHTGGFAGATPRSIGYDRQGNAYAYLDAGGDIGFVQNGTLVWYYAPLGTNNVVVTKQNTSGDFVWIQRIGGVEPGEAFSMKIDNSGNFFLTGNFKNAVDFDPGPGTYYMTNNGAYALPFMCLYDSAFQSIWAKQLSGSPLAEADLMASARDRFGNVYLAGQFMDTLDFDPGPGTYFLSSPNSWRNFLLKLDSAGNFDWAKKIMDCGGGTSIITSMAVDSAGFVLLVGNYNGQCEFDPDSASYIFSDSGAAFICKLDANGNFLFGRQFGIRSAGIGIQGLVADRDNSIYFTGNFSDTVDFDPGAGNYFMQTYMRHVGNIYFATSNIYVCKLDSDGIFNWAVMIKDSSSGDKSVTMTTDNFNLYITGNFSGPADFNPQSGTFYMTKCNAVSDAFVLKLDMNGDFVWAKQTCGMDRVEANALAANLDDVYLLGTFDSITDFDPGTMVYNIAPAYSRRDLFFLKLGLPTGIETINALFGISVAPNPTYGHVFVQCTSGPMNRVEVFDMLGQKLLSVKTSLRKQDLDLTHLTCGIYFIKVFSGNQIGTLKIVKD